MTHVRLPDASSRQLAAGASAEELAAEIGAGLARAAVAARVNGEVVDLRRPLPEGAEQVDVAQPRNYLEASSSPQRASRTSSCPMMACRSAKSSLRKAGLLRLLPILRRADRRMPR